VNQAFASAQPCGAPAATAATAAVHKTSDTVAQTTPSKHAQQLTIYSPTHIILLHQLQQQRPVERTDSSRHATRATATAAAQWCPCSSTAASSWPGWALSAEALLLLLEAEWACCSGGA
jgi:hypothetical protein